MCSGRCRLCGHSPGTYGPRPSCLPRLPRANKSGRTKGNQTKDWARKKVRKEVSPRRPVQDENMWTRSSKCWQKARKNCPKWASVKGHDHDPRQATSCPFFAGFPPSVDALAFTKTLSESADLRPMSFLPPSSNGAKKGMKMRL